MSEPSSLNPTETERDPERVRAMFGRVARRYDLANHLLSLGLDFWWRRRASDIIRKWRPRRVLALAIARKVPEAEITGADFCAEMLAVARRKGLTNTVVADALQLPFPAGSFDVVTVAFGLRNMADWSAALGEMGRVLRVGGHLLVLDFSLPKGFLRPLYRFYLHRFVPSIAGVVTGERDAYRYLGASIEKFPSGDAMCELLERSGLRTATAQPLSGGIVNIYRATKSS
jgi:demethylmenaquinone methyltransferase/2-methoxy-6-polyprenyl-1,4-benzoquinol methylase